MKFKVSTKSAVKRKKNKDASGLLYVLCFELEGKELIKIGVTTRPIQDRVSEILTSIFKKHRVFPYCKPKKYSKFSDVYKEEAAMHKVFASFSYVPEKRFSGSTEFFEAPLDAVITEYEKRLKADRDNIKSTKRRRRS